jgi:uncharacterized membrane protein
MANKNQHVIIAYFDGADKADAAANQLKDWDKANDAVKLGGIGILFWEDGKVKTRKVGGRAAGTGAKWGTILGIATGILSGGVTLIGGAIAGVAGGAVLGSLFHKGLGLDDGDKARLEEHLRQGGAALVVMADEDEVVATSEELKSLNGKVEGYAVPAETVEQAEATEEVKPAAPDEASA